MAKILIVDDSGMSRRILRRILGPEEHQLLEAHDGMTALEQYGLHRPDLVLLDLTMSGMHGLEVLEKLQWETVLRHIEAGTLDGYSILATVLIDGHQDQANWIRDFIAAN